jgi:hypothetical protein
MVQEEIHYPYFELLIKDCKNFMLKKFPEYKNSWENIKYIDSSIEGVNFWNERLDGEYQELLEAKSDAEKYKELIDMINICSMMATTNIKYNEIDG